MDDRGKEGREGRGERRKGEDDKQLHSLTFLPTSWLLWQCLCVSHTCLTCQKGLIDDSRVIVQSSCKTEVKGHL